MKIHSLLATILFVGAFSLPNSSSLANGRPILRVAYFDLQSHIRQESGHARGPALEYLLTLAIDMQVELDVQASSLPLERLLIQMEAGTIDAIVALGRNERRERLYQFPPNAFFRMRPALAVARSAGIMRADTESLRGKRIGVYSGGYLSPLIEDSQLRREALHGNNVTTRNVEKLMMGRLDAVYSPDAEDLRMAIAKLGQQDRLRVIYLPEPPVGMFTVFSQRVPKSVVYRYAKALERAPRYIPLAAAEDRNK